MTHCTHCGKLVDPNLDNCPYCGGFLRPQRPEPAQQERAPSQTCPSCGALVQPGDIICVACGTNLLTGQKIAEDRRVKRPPRRINWAWVGGGLAALVVVAVIVAGVIILTRDPVARAKKLAAGGNNTEAIQILEQYTSKNPNNIRAENELGNLYWKTQRYGQAANVLEKVAKQDNSRRNAAMLAVVCLDSAGTPDYNRAISLLQTLVQNDPNDFQALYLLALARGAQGNVDGQIDALKRAVQANPGQTAPRKSLGVAYALNGDYEQARKNLSAALIDEPDNANALAALGIVEQLSKQPNQAEKNLTAAIKGQTSILNQARMQLGLLLLRQGRYEDAYPQFDAVLTADANNQGARFFRAICIKQRGLDDEALKDFQQIAQQQGAFSAQASMEAAEIYLTQKDADLAKSALQRAEDQGASGAPFLTLKGRVNVLNGDNVTAQDMFKRATITDPNYAPAYLENGLVYVHRGMFKEGIASLKRYIQLADPSLPGSGVKEIQTLVDQLQTSLGSKS